MPSEKKYDAFLSFKEQDQNAVEEIANWLYKTARLKVWIYSMNIIPGAVWQKEILNALDHSRCFVVFIGGGELGRWQDKEIELAINKCVSEGSFTVIPVLLPNGVREEKESELPAYLRDLYWVKFDQNIHEEENLKKLVSGIKGKLGRRINTKSNKHILPEDEPEVFRGLEVFREKDADLFFGRDALVQRLLGHLEKYHFLTILGPSGSGKSSIVQAGLIPELRPTHNLVMIFTPQDNPLLELTISLHKLYQIFGETPNTETTLERLKKSPEALYFITRELIQKTSKENKETKILLVIDQFEELFTQIASEGDRQQFILLILTVKEKSRGRVNVVITMRSDFIGKCAIYVDLNNYINDYSIQVAPMSNEELRSAIEGPARESKINLTFEAGLVDQILRDVKGATGELPLLEFALLELYKKKQDNVLTHAAYQQIGGVEGALINRANTEYNILSNEQKEILRRMFVLHMVQPGDGTEDTRRRATWNELTSIGVNPKSVEDVINRWAGPAVRILTVSQDSAHNRTFVYVAHEAMIRRWDKIKDWLNENRDLALQIGRLRGDASEWEKSNRNPDFLHHGTRLFQIQDLREKYGNDLTSSEIEFIETGVKIHEQRQNEELQNTKRVAKEQSDLRDEAVKSSLIAQKKSRTAIIRSHIAIVVAWLCLNLLAFSFILFDQNQDQLIRNYWYNSQAAITQHNYLNAILFIAEAINKKRYEPLNKNLLISIQPYLPVTSLKTLLEMNSGLLNAEFNPNGTQIIT